MKGGRRNSNSREKRRRAVVSSADYGDFVVSDSRRESHRCRPNIVDFALKITEWDEILYLRAIS